MLPVQLQRKLNLAGCPLKEQRGTGGGDRAGGRITYRCIRVVELRRVEHVERFGTELEMLTLLAEIEVLELRDVELFCARAPSEYFGPSCRTCSSRVDKAGRVIPALESLIRDRPGPDSVRR